jgi:hypothetical protein
MNLFSVLRMIKKPILGINDGCKLMCNQLIDKNKCGLGFFDVKINIEDDKNISLVEETGKINFNNSTKLLSKKYENQSVRFYPQIQPSLYLDSNAEITVAENKYSFLYESKNHYGLILDGDKNEEIFNEVVKNFLFI